jgi:uncharacterized protein
LSLERLFADTNVFLRYLTNDVQDQADAVEEMLQRAARGEIVLVTSVMVIAEIVWTPGSFYGLQKSDIQNKVLAILHTPGLEVEDAQMVEQAVNWYVQHNIDFIDAYNASWMLSQGLQKACTFDHKHFSRIHGLTVIVPAKS